MSTDHLDHITANPSGLHVPYLGAGRTNRSPAVDLDVDNAGRPAIRRHPLHHRRFMACIHLADTPIWICTDHLAHRSCDHHCLDIWANQWTYQQLDTPSASPFTLTHLTFPHRQNDPALLHTSELSAVRLADLEAAQ